MVIQPLPHGYNRLPLLLFNDISDHQCAMLCISTAYAVVRCLRFVSVTFVYCVETAKDTAIVATEFEYFSKLYASFRKVWFSVILNDPIPYFKVKPLFDAEYLRNGTRRRHYNEILIWTYPCPTQGCHFKWPWVISSKLAKYSMTRSTRGHCDSWASCLKRNAFIVIKY